ncbi:MAG: hypothetical protein WCO60_07060 [Verrucomicrobiota bacterium]
MNLETGFVLKKDAIIDVDHSFVEGMLGQVMPDPYGICIPGMDVLVRAVGMNQPQGYDCLQVERIGAPTKIELHMAKELAVNAYKLYRERNGWCGIVLVGNQHMTEERARYLPYRFERIQGMGVAKDGENAGIS